MIKNKKRVILTQSGRCGLTHLLGGQGHWENVEGPLLFICRARRGSQRVGGHVSKVALFIGRQEMVVAKVTVVQHVRTITEVYIQVGQLKIAIHCSCLGVAQQACHTLELVGAVAVARGEEQPVSLLMLHFASPATKKKKIWTRGGTPSPPGSTPAAAAAVAPRAPPPSPPLPTPPPPPPPPKKKGERGRGGEGGRGGKKLT